MASTSPVQPISADRSQALLAALSGHLPKQAVPLPYRVGLFLATVTMVLLPLVYVGLIALASYGMYWEAVVLYKPLVVETRRGSSALLYFGLLLSGVILIVFMIKPLFAPRSKKDTLRTLSRKGEPLLYAFVEKLCEVVGAPKPRSIQVNNEINAAAGLRRGVWSLFDRNDLVLIIGLPLAGGLTLQQFAGVLAHEFGHFSQSTGMRLSWVIRSMSAWFHRVVYERDAWDDFIVSACEWDIRVSFPFYLARVFVWLSRKVLWVLMMLGHLITCYLLRQMEYDADTYETRLAGSRAFADTARQLPVLGVASQAAHSALAESWSEGRLADNFPGLVLAKRSELTPEVIGKIQKHYGERKTGWFETHPADCDRIAASERMNSPGIFTWEGTADQLFADYSDLCKKVSWDFYQEVLGAKVKAENIHPLAEMLGRQEAAKEGQKAIERYLQRGLSLLRPLGLGTPPAAATVTLALDEDLPAPPPPVDAECAREKLAALRNAVLEQAPSHQTLLEEYSSQYKRRTLALRAEALLRCNFRIEAKEFQLNGNTLKSTEIANAQVKKQFESLDPQLKRFDQLAVERLKLALDFLATPGVPEQFPALQPWAEEAARLRPVLEILYDNLPKALETTESLAVAGVLLQQLKDNQPPEALVGQIRAKAHGLETKLTKLQKALAGTTYPFDHVKGTVPLTEFIFRSKHIPSGDEIGQVLQEADFMWDRISDLYIRVLGRLSLAAEAVEKELGMEPLPVPPEKKEEKQEAVKK